MDIQHLVDRLEDLIDEGRHIFGTKYTMIDEERALELIDQMRISIPEEIEKSQRVLAQRERIMSEANEEAARILAQQRQKADLLVEEQSSVQAAYARAESIKEQARQEAARITAEADAYVLEMLSRLESQLLRNVEEVRNGIEMLNEVEAPMSAPSLPSQPVHIPRMTDYETVDMPLDTGYESEN